MNKKSKLLLVGIVLAAVLAGAAVFLSHQNIAVLNPKGPVAAEERRLILFGLLLSAVVVVPVFAMAIGIAIRYRETNTKATYAPEWDHSRLAESIWWGVPALLITILSVVAWNSSHSLDPFRLIKGSAPPLTVQVVALDWKWLFIYPQQHVATVNYLELPVNAAVTFQITSDAPMNSFWIPQLGGQIYAMPGMSTELHLLASSPGNYYGSSANISGRGFADMHFLAHAVTAGEFYTWENQARMSNERLDMAAYDSLAQPSVNNKPMTFALAETDIFGSVVQKYMAPGGQMSPDMMANSEMSGMGAQ